MDSEISTLYFHNLNERVNRTRLQHELRTQCERYGPVVSIHTGKSIKKRGQAYVAFKDSQNARAALEDLIEKELFSKPIKVAFARSNSDAVKSTGAIEARKRSRHTTLSADAEKMDKTSATVSASSSSEPSSPIAAPPAAKKPRLPENEPHNVLLLQNIPDAIKLENLQELCQDLEGYKEARMFAVKHVGFVEFEDIETASAAIGVLSERNAGDINFAKK